MNVWFLPLFYNWDSSDRMEAYHSLSVGDGLHRMLLRRACLLPVQQTDLKRITESCEIFIFGPVCTWLRVLPVIPPIKRTNDSDV